MREKTNFLSNDVTLKIIIHFHVVFWRQTVKEASEHLPSYIAKPGIYNSGFFSLKIAQQTIAYRSGFPGKAKSIYK